MTHIWICRHPPTQSNGLCIGQSPVPISISWDEAVKRVLESTPVTPTELWTSDLPRCHTLANLCSKSWKVSVQVDPNLREISMGSWQGQSYDDLQTLDTHRWEEWCGDWQHVIPPDGENIAMLRDRVKAWLSQTTLSTEPVLIAHAGVVRTLRVLAGASWEAAMSTPVPHLTWEKIGVLNGKE